MNSHDVLATGPTLAVIGPLAIAGADIRNTLPGC